MDQRPLAASSYKDLLHRLQLAWGAAKSLRRLWRSPLSDRTKVRLFQTLIGTTLLYGSEAWLLTKSQRQRLFNGYNRLLRFALNISWQSHTKTETVYSRANISYPATVLATRILESTFRILNGPKQPAQHILAWQPRLPHRRSYRSASSFGNTLHTIATDRGSTPLTRVSPRSRAQRIQHVLSDIKDKTSLRARLRKFPPNLTTFELLQRSPAPKRTRGRRATGPPRTERAHQTPDHADEDPATDLSTRMGLA